MKKLVYVFLSLILFTECSDSADKKTENLKAEEKQDSIPESTQQTLPEKPQVSLPDNTVIFERMYATSSAIDETNLLSNLFDHDMNTTWSTLPGSGPDEGIMLNFNSPTLIKMINIRK